MGDNAFAAVNCKGWRMVFTGIFGLGYTFAPVTLLTVAAVMPIIDMSMIGDFCAMAGSLILALNRPYAVWMTGAGGTMYAFCGSIFLGGTEWEEGKKMSFGGLAIQIIY